MRACLLIRSDPPYRRDAFARGLQANGYTVDQFVDPKPGNVLVIWNRYGANHEYALRYERAGCRVIVAENGYLGREWNGHVWYAMALSHHNGCGVFPLDEGQRLAKHGQPAMPWNTEGEDILVLPQRGIGEVGVAQPPNWLRNLQLRTKRRIRIRQHPGENKQVTPLEQDLQNVYATVVWGSGAAIKGLMRGVPCFHTLPGWIGASAARPLSRGLEDRFLGDRTTMLRRLFCAMWRLDEIESGEAIQCLLQQPAP